MKTVGALMFSKFEMLDLFGPLEMFGMLPEEFQIKMIAQGKDPVQCTQGPQILVDATLEQAKQYSLILVPGGAGTRVEVNNSQLLEWITDCAKNAEVIMSVCTGSALLARAGVLDGRQATTNKRAFDWVRAQSAKVDWVRHARWVQDQNVYTSSGVSAGMDMSLAVISNLCGAETAKQVSIWAEYEWNDNPDWDPFAEPSDLA